MLLRELYRLTPRCPPPMIFKEFDRGIKFLGKNPLVLDINDNLILFNCTMKLSHLDGKARALATGLLGAYCLMCTVSSNDSHVKEIVRQGFKIDRNIESVCELFEALAEPDENGELIVPKRRGDYKERAGLTQMPITEQNVCEDFSVMHAYLRMFHFILGLIYRLNAGVKIWGQGKRRTTVQIKALDHAKALFKARVKEDLKMVIDTPNASCGGTSDTGETCKRFFNAKHRNAIIQMLSDHVTADEKKALRGILQEFSVILRVINSGEKVHVDLLNTFCTATYLKIL